MGAEWTPNEAQTSSERILNGFRIDPDRALNRSRTNAERTPNESRTEPERTPSGSQTYPEPIPKGGGGQEMYLESLVPYCIETVNCKENVNTVNKGKQRKQK